MKILIPILFLLAACGQGKETATTILVTEDSISQESINLTDSLSASIHALDSLRPIVQNAVAKLKHYESLKIDYEQQEAEIIYKPIIDSSAIITLRSKLTAANNEIARLRGELSLIESKRNVQPVIQEYVQPAVITPDENSIVIELDGKSRKGDIVIPSNLTIYLIPGNGKKHQKYEAACSQGLEGNTTAKYYNGLYFFNSVEPGKYLIKICTYYGNFKLIDKPSGKYNLKMLIAPPIQ